MANLILRLVKGSPLTNQEVDDNFSALNTDKLEAADLIASDTSYDNSSSGLFASTVQAAIDELNVKKVDVGDVRVGVSLFPTTVDVSGEYLMASATTDEIYDETAVDVATGSISNDTVVATTVSEAGLIVGEIENVNVHLVGNIRKTVGNENDYASFYFKVYHRDDSLGADVLIATSGPTQPVNGTGNYIEYVADALIATATFAAEDKIVLEFIATNVAGSPEYEFEFGGATPVRFTMPVALANINEVTDATNVLVDTASFAGVLGVADSTVQAALETLDAAVPANVSDLPNDAGYLTAETDPVFTASEAASITATDKANWTTAYTWGNHADQGYLTSYTETDPVFTLSEAFNVGTGDVDFGSNKITYANQYNQLSDLPSATIYHGMFAHVHSTGKGYFAHAGTWVEIKDENTPVTEAEVTQHQAALQITESQITDLQDYVTEAPADGNQYARKDSGWEQVVPPVTTEEDPIAKSDAEYLRHFTTTAAALLGRQGGEYKMAASPGIYDAETASASYPSGQQYTAGEYDSPASPFTVMGGTWFSYPVHIVINNNHPSAQFSFRVLVQHVSAAGVITDVMFTRSIFVAAGVTSNPYLLDGTDTNVEGDVIYNSAITFEEGDSFRLKMYIENQDAATQSFDWVHPDRYYLTSNGQDNNLFRMPKPWKPLLFHYDLDGLLDVNAGTATTGQALIYDGTEWVSDDIPATEVPEPVGTEVVLKTSGMHWMPISQRQETYFSGSTRNELGHAIPIVDKNWSWDEYTISGGAGVSTFVARIEFPQGAYVGETEDLGLTVQVRLRHNGSQPITQIQVGYGKRSAEGAESTTIKEPTAITSTTSAADYTAAAPTTAANLTITADDCMFVDVLIFAPNAWEAVISDTGNANDITTLLPVGVYAGSKRFIGGQDVHIGANDIRSVAQNENRIDGTYVYVGRDASLGTYIDGLNTRLLSSQSTYIDNGGQTYFQRNGNIEWRHDSSGIRDTSWQSDTPNVPRIQFAAMDTKEVRFYTSASGYTTTFTGSSTTLTDSDSIARTTDITNLQAQIDALSANKIGEAPFDGRTYVRQNGDWVQVDLGLDLLVFAFDGGRATTINFATSIDGGVADTPIFDDAVSPLIGGVANSTYELSPAISGDSSMSSAAGTVYNIDGGLADTSLFSSTLNGGAA